MTEKSSFDLRSCEVRCSFDDMVEAGDWLVKLDILSHGNVCHGNLTVQYPLYQGIMVVFSCRISRPYFHLMGLSVRGITPKDSHDLLVIGILGNTGATLEGLQRADQGLG